MTKTETITQIVVLGLTPGGAQMTYGGQWSHHGGTGAETYRGLDGLEPQLRADGYRRKRAACWPAKGSQAATVTFHRPGR